MLLLLLLAGFMVFAPRQLSAQSDRLTFSLRNASFKEIVSEIKRIAAYDFVYSDADITGIARKDVSFSNATISQVLSRWLQGTGLTGEVNGKTIVIRKAAARPATRPVSGVVTDASGTPIAGAAVMIKGTSSGAVTDAAGRFSLNVPAGAAATLTVSSVGTETREVAVNAQTANVNVRLESTTTGIDDVVVTGIFVKAKESYTGAVTQITTQELKMFRGQNLVSTLGNIDPSINILNNNTFGSDPNRLPDITIRGNSSLPRSIEELNSGAAAQLNTPLIIMDGFEVSLQKLVDFNVDDIQSINILKDAASTAFYGSRGANGVIVITTRLPQLGNLRFSLQLGLNIEVPDLTSYNLMDAREKLNLEWAAGIYSSGKGPIGDVALLDFYSKKLAAVNSGVDTYWLSQPLQTSLGPKMNLRMDWGRDELQFGASIAYNSIHGVMKGSERNVFNGSLTVAYRYKNVRFRNAVDVDIVRSENSKYGSFSSYTKMNPYWSVYDGQGELIPNYWTMPQGHNMATQVANPLYDASLNVVDQAKYNTLTNNFTVEWDIVQGLKLKANLGVSHTQNSSDKYLPRDHSTFKTYDYELLQNYFRKGTYDYSTGENTRISGNATLSYSKTFNQKHQVYAGLDYKMSNFDMYDYVFKVEGIASDRLSFMPSAMQYALGTKPNGSEDVRRDVGITGNVNYTYDQRYFVDLSYRYDGSSLFGTENKFAPFWSAGLGWNAHKESFLEDNNVLNRLRLRGSYGKTGSQQFEAYQSLSTFRYMIDKRYLMWSGAQLAGIGNDHLKWQNTYQGNIGMDLGLFNDRLEASVDVYIKKTTDLLSEMNLSLDHGFSSYVANVGAIDNNGCEVMLKGTIIRNPERNIVWNVVGKMAYNKNTIKKLSQAIKEQTELYLINNPDAEDLLYENDPSHSIYAVPSLGIDPSTGEEIFLSRNGNVTRKWNAADRRWCGALDPLYRGNVSTYFGYGNWALNLSFAYHWGGQQYNQTLINRVEVTDAQLLLNVDKRVYDDRWQKPGDVKFFKGYNQINETPKSSRFVMDDNVFEMQTASLTYRWASAGLKASTGIEAANFQFNMSDIFYISSIKRERGLDYPFSRKMSLTVSLTF